jgi:hypothetical protein
MANLEVRAVTAHRRQATLQHPASYSLAGQQSDRSNPMVETKYDTSHHAGATPEARIASRLRNSGDTKNADHSVVHGTGPTRAHTNVHLSGHQARHGAGNDGEGDVNGNKRGVV